MTFSVLPVFLSLFLFVTRYEFALSQDIPSRLDEVTVKNMRKQIDSLVRIVTFSSDDTTKVNLLVEISSQLTSISKYDSAVTVAQSALGLAKRLNNPKSLIRAYLALGGAYGNFGSRDYEKSLAYLREGAAVCTANNFYAQLHGFYYGILNLHFYSGNFPAAMEVATTGLKLAESKKDESRILHYHNLFGFIYLRQGNIAEAEKNYTVYLSMGKAGGDSLAMADAYNCLAEVFFSRKEYQRALDYHFLSWGIYNRYLQAGRNFKPDQLAYTAYRISKVYKLRGDYAEADKYSSIAFGFTRRHGTNEYDMVSYLHNASEIHQHEGRYKKSLALVHQSLKLSLRMQHLENIRDSYFLLAGIHKNLRQYDSAFHYQGLYSALKDSIVNEQTRREVEHIMASYSLEKKDREIESLQQAKKLSEAQADRERLVRNTVIIIMLFVLVLLYLLYNRYRLKQKNRFQLELSQQQNNMFNAIAAVQDQERKRIAQDIHDSLGSLLSTAKLRLSAMETLSLRMDPHEKDQFQNVIGLLDEAVAELRSISQNIMPATLSRLGLVAALQNLFDKISGYSGTRIQYTVHGFTGRLEESVEMIIYRVVLELVNNVVKHAAAENLTVQLIQYADHVNVTVEDDGVGFDLQQTKKKKPGMGLDNIASRMEYLKGRIEIDTQPGQGTSIMLDFPLTSKATAAFL